MDYRKIYAERYGIVIPEGYDIHHVDLNHDNNDIANLLLMPHGLHMRLHKCIQSGISTIAQEALRFEYCGMPAHCSSSSEILKEYAEVYAEVFYWSAAKDFEELRAKGQRGWMPYNYNEFRHE